MASFRKFRVGRGVLVVALACGLLPAGAAAQAQPPASIEYKLLVTVDRAVVRAEPDAASASVIVLAKGATLSSFEQSGTWYRVVVDAGEGGIVLVGFLSETDVRIVGQKIRESADFWAVLDREFRGVGLSVRVSVGRASVPWGDLGRGTQGTFFGESDRIMSEGWTVDQESFDLAANGYEVSVDLYYKLSRFFEVVGGFSAYEDNSSNWREFGRAPGYSGGRLTMQNFLRAYTLRLGGVARLPVFWRISVFAEGGLLVPFVRYSTNFQVQVAPEWVDFGHNVRSHGLGGFGALGIELALTSRGSLFFEFRGRTADGLKFDGSESRRLDRQIGQPWVTRREGRLFFGSEPGRPVGLAVMPAKEEGYPGYREVSLRLRSFGFGVGLRLKF